MTSTVPAPRTFTLPANQPDLRASREAWAEHARILAAIVAGADLRDSVEQMLTPTLVVTKREWSPGIGDAVQRLIAARGLDENCSDVWRELCGPATTTELSEDGQYFTSSTWCPCVPEGHMSEGSVYVERWTTHGRTFHGWVCRVCRNLQQAG